MSRFVYLLPLVLLCVGCPKSDSAVPSGTSSKGAASGGPSSGAGRPTQGANLPHVPNVELGAGLFVMGSEGSTKGGQDCERPRREESLPKAIYFDVHEVTNADYARFLGSPELKAHTFCHSEEPKAKDHTPAGPTPKERTWGAVVDPFKGAGRETHPVVGVDWFDAYAFASWMGRRLPSEEEFEKAARGEDGRKFPWGEGPARGDDGKYRANGHFAKDGHKMTAPVGSFPAGKAPCGALDVAGNVWEWTHSPFLSYVGAPEGTREDGEQNVIRGGGWNSPTSFLLRGAMRVPQAPSYRSTALGFRTVSSVSVPASKGGS